MRRTLKRRAVLEGRGLVVSWSRGLVRIVEAAKRPRFGGSGAEPPGGAPGGMARMARFSRGARMARVSRVARMARGMRPSWAEAALGQGLKPGTQPSYHNAHMLSSAEFYIDDHSKLGLVPRTGQRRLVSVDGLPISELVAVTGIQ